MNIKVLNKKTKNYFVDKYDDFTYKIYRWFVYTSFGTWWLEFTNGIKQLFKWRKVIYHNYDYDYNGLYSIMGFKLKTLRETFEKNQHTVSWEEDVKWIKICENLCEKVGSGYYTEEPFEFYDLNMEFKELEDGDSYEMNSDVVRDELDIYFSKYPKIKDKVYNEIKNSKLWVEGAEDGRSFLAGRMGEHLHNKARKLLFKIIAEKIEYWWD